MPNFTGRDTSFRDQDSDPDLEQIGWPKRPLRLDSKRVRYPKGTSARRESPVQKQTRQLRPARERSVSGSGTDSSVPKGEPGSETITWARIGVKKKMGPKIGDGVDFGPKGEPGFGHGFGLVGKTGSGLA